MNPFQRDHLVPRLRRRGASQELVFWVESQLADVTLEAAGSVLQQAEGKFEIDDREKLVGALLHVLVTEPLEPKRVELVRGACAAMGVGDEWYAWRLREELGLSLEQLQALAELRLPRTFSQDEMEDAYDAQMLRYDPDRMAEMGDEFATLAKARSEALAAARETLMDSPVGPMPAPVTAPVDARSAEPVPDFGHVASEEAEPEPEVLARPDNVVIDPGQFVRKEIRRQKFPWGKLVAAWAAGTLGLGLLAGIWYAMDPGFERSQAFWDQLRYGVEAQMASTGAVDDTLPPDFLVPEADKRLAALQSVGDGPDSTRILVNVASADEDLRVRRAAFDEIVARWEAGAGDAAVFELAVADVTAVSSARVREDGMKLLRERAKNLFSLMPLLEHGGRANQLEGLTLIGEVAAANESWQAFEEMLRDRIRRETDGEVLLVLEATLRDLPSHEDKYQGLNTSKKIGQ